MSGKYNIVERLEVYEANFAHDGRMGMSEDMTTARDLIQELAEALETARGYVVDARTDQHAVALSRTAHPKIYARESGRHASICDDVQKIDAILYKLKGA